MIRIPPNLRRRRWKLLGLFLLTALVLTPVWVPREVAQDLGVDLPERWMDALAEWVDPAGSGTEDWTPFKQSPVIEPEAQEVVAKPRQFPGRRYRPTALERAEREQRLRFEDEGLSVGIDGSLRLHLNSQGARPDNALDTRGIVPTPEEERLRQTLEEQRIRIGLGGEF